MGGSGDLIEHVIGVGDADENGFVGTGGHGDTAREHGVEESGKGRFVSALGFGKVGGRGNVATHHAEQCADYRKVGSEASSRTRFAQQARQPCGTRRQFEVHVAVELAQRSEPGGGGDGIARQRASMENGTERREVLHQLASTADRPDRQTTADDFAERGEVGLHAVHGLCATQADTKTGDHFVEHQHRTHAVTLGSQSFEKAWRRRNDAHVGGDGFDDDARHGVVEDGHHVVGHHQGFGHGACRNTGSTGQTERRHPAATRRQQGVGCSVEVAVKDHHPVATGVPASQAHCGAGGFGTRVHESHLFARRDPLGNRFGKLHLAWCGGPVRRAAGDRAGDRSSDGRVGMAQDHCAVALYEIDVALARYVPQMRAVGPRHDIWLPAD